MDPLTLLHPFKGRGSFVVSLQQQQMASFIYLHTRHFRAALPPPLGEVGLDVEVRSNFLGRFPLDLFKEARFEQGLSDTSDEVAIFARATGLVLTRGGAGGWDGVHL